MAGLKAEAMYVRLGINVMPLQEKITMAQRHLDEAWKILDELSSTSLEIVTPSGESVFKQGETAASEDGSSPTEKSALEREAFEEMVDSVGKSMSAAMKMQQALGIGMSSRG